MINNLFLIAILILLLACNQSIENDGNILVLYTDKNEQTGYRKLSGKVVIPAGKYTYCFTDTFRTFALVSTKKEIIAIDRDDKKLYEVFVFDNGPDYAQEGLFRIVKNGKIGYADATTGKIVIEPAYDGAYPFENGKARVSIGCKTITDGEHKLWTEREWFYIDRNGKQK